MRFCTISFRNMNGIEKCIERFKNTQKPNLLLQTTVKYFVIFGIIGIMSLIPSIHATDENVIRIPYAKIAPVIDGKFTLEKEWNNASVTNFESNGYDFYLQTKQDKDYVYLMFDGVDFQTDPKDNSTSVRYQAVVCLDADGNRGLEKQLGDVCFISTEYNEFGDPIKTEHRILHYKPNGESEIVDMPEKYNAVWGFGNENDPFEKIKHLTYEVIIPKENLIYDQFGFGFSMYFNSSHDELVQLVDGVIWPAESDKDMPDTWGTMDLRKPLTPLKQFKYGIDPWNVKCNEGLVLLQKYDGSPACVENETKKVLVERSWAKPDIRASTE